MKTFKRGSDDFFAVFQDDKLWYRVGVYRLIEIFSDELERKPYHIHKARFEHRWQAEVACEMLQEEYQDGLSDGQGSCY